jgi:branched-subunit amino acid ABC-type transport system permease component
MWLSDLLQTLIFALATGGVIAVGAVGLSLSYGVTRFINFSYGGFLTIGAYVSVLLVSLGLKLPLAIVIAMLAVGVLGVIVAKIFFDPVMRRGSLVLLVTSVGLAFMLQNLVRMVAGSTPLRFPLPLLRPWHLGSLFVPKVPVLVVAVALLCMLLVHLTLRLTLLGKMMRATSDNRALAQVSGVKTGQVLSATWFISSAIAALGGVLLGMTQVALQPVMGWSFLLVIFSAVLLGGAGSAYGAMLGALIVGFGVEFGSSYISSNYGYAFAFLILVLVLLLRPTGLLGRRV